MEAVTLVPHDPTWAAQFAAEQQRLAQVFSADSSPIEHVGSTAIPGLVAKPVIDILVGVSSLGVAEGAVVPLRDLQYQYVPEYEVQIPQRRYFRKPMTRPRSHHLHCVVLGSPEWDEMLRFRDILRADGRLRDKYADLKRSLAASESRQDYTAKKAPFIRTVLGRAAPR
jgi:GrpB-like predicted nucleotidyltransferase (UPF0157 family)